MIIREIKISPNPSTLRKPLPSLQTSLATSASQASSSSEKICLLIMGGDANYCEETSYHLQAVGLKLVPIFLDEAGLVETIRASAPALVLIDWDTLGETALKTCLFLRNYLLGRSIPVAILSNGARNDGSVMRAFSSGADDFIEDATKPRLLVSRIKAMLRLRARHAVDTSDMSGSNEDLEQPEWINSQAV